jgi:hypothetical protein
VQSCTEQSCAKLVPTAAFGGSLIEAPLHIDFIVLSVRAIR